MAALRSGLPFLSLLAFACSGGPAPLTPPPTSATVGAPGLELEPYLLHKSDDTARLAWRTADERPSQVRFGRTFVYEALTLRTEPGVMHMAELPGLLPETLYHYEVDGAAKGSFRTLRACGDRSFVVLSHTHGSESITHYPDELLAATVEDLRPDFVVHCGDTTFLTAYRHFRRYFFGLFETLLRSTPIYVSPANHDSGFPFLLPIGLQPFKQLFAYPYAGDEGDACYAVEQGHLRLLVLSYVSAVGPGSAQRRWLADRLAEKGWDFQAVVFGGSHDMYYDQASLLDFLVEHGADLVFRGDGAQPEDFAQQHSGMPMFFVGTGNEKPHAFLLGKLTEGNLVIRRGFVDGRIGRPHQLATKQRRAPVVSLEPELAVNASRIAGYRAIPTRPVDSGTIRGMQMDVTIGEGKLAELGVLVVPDDCEEQDLAAGYPVEHLPRLGPGRHLVTLALHTRHPVSGHTFPLRSLKLVFTGVGGADVDIEKVVLY